MTPDTRSSGRSTLRRVLTVLGLVVLVAALVPFLVFAVPQVVGADHGFVILSGSMEPSVSPGDVVIVDASAAIAVGDVITFDNGNEIPTTHRVVGVVDGQYVTKGDANENADAQPVDPSNVLGEVTVTIPLVGHVILWVNTPTGYVALVVVPLVLLLANELYMWARRGKPDDEEPTLKPAIRHVDDVAAERRAAEAAAAAETPPSRETVAVAVTDLKLTVLAMAGLVAYAGLNVYREVTGLGAPDPVSVGALTGGLLGLAFAVWVTVSARLAARSAAAEASTDAPSRSRPAQTDGGTPEVER
ncbi:MULTISPECIES: signal peptidase I [Salinibaculum]|uniref:signal peptidase I n=1 Tax=Salinibaculum TaxID=2732368 RepID=UPI0030D0F793